MCVPDLTDRRINENSQRGVAGNFQVTGGIYLLELHLHLPAGYVRKLVVVLGEIALDHNLDPEEPRARHKRQLTLCVNFATSATTDSEIRRVSRDRVHGDAQGVGCALRTLHLQ